MHRIARTGRHIKKGISLSFYRGKNSKKYNIHDSELEKELKSIEKL